MGLFHADHGRIGPVKGNKLAVGDENTHGCALLDDQRGITIIRANAKEIAVGAAALRLDELVAHVIAEAEGVMHIMPVGFPEDEPRAVFHLPLVHLCVQGPPGIPVNIFDAPDIINGVHKQADIDGLAVNITNQGPLVMRGVYALVRVEQLHIQYGGVIAAQRDGIGVRRGRVSAGLLVGIVDGTSLHHGVGLYRDKGGPFLASGAAHRFQYAAVHRQLFPVHIAKTRMGRCIGKGAAQGDIRRYGDGALETVPSGRHFNNATIYHRCCVQCLLKNESIVPRPVRTCAIVHDGTNHWIAGDWWNIQRDKGHEYKQQQRDTGHGVFLLVYPWVDRVKPYQKIQGFPFRLQSMVAVYGKMAANPIMFIVSLRVLYYSHAVSPRSRLA
ncbi:MAG: hypothetical protein BWY09_02993 [Candidatus Hydrogenedentes bacterium ADurb.Bin179]|nr:MAG: hypothetical protein BWY09_02993 [Candidatus Hydrogenedentes bacterium ADurb.Bin179]